MDFWQSLALLGRRWAFFGFALLLAAVVTGGVFHAVKPQYQATSELLLVPPPTSSTKITGNFINDYGNLNTVASIVSYRENSQQVATQLKAIGIDNYTVSTDPTGAVPELIITVTASDPPLVLSQNRTLTKEVANVLLAMQAGASPDTLITTRFLEEPTQATRNDKSRIRVVVAVGVVLVFLAVALTSLYDSLRQRRTPARKHEEKSSTPMPGEAGFESDPPRLADGRVLQRAGHEYSVRTESEPGSRSVGAPGASSAPAQFYPKS
jgi:hypothetical protein